MPFFLLVLSIFALVDGESIGPILQQDVHLFLSDLELIADSEDGTEVAAAAQQWQKHQKVNTDQNNSGRSRTVDGLSLRHLMEEENERAEEEAGNGNVAHLLANLYYRTDNDRTAPISTASSSTANSSTARTSTANSSTATSSTASSSTATSSTANSSIAVQKCHVEVGLTELYMEKYEQQMRQLMQGKLKREIGEMVQKLISRPNRECPTDEEIKKVMEFSLYLLGYHFTAQLMDERLMGKRLLSLYSPYFKLQDQLDKSGNALIKKLTKHFGMAEQPKETNTVHKLAKHLYWGKDKVLVEQMPFLETAEQKSLSFLQKIMRKKLPQSIKYQPKGSQHPDNVLWTTFNRTTGRVFKDFRELRQRFEIFTKNQKMVQQHNEENEKGMNSFTMCINQLADWTRAELRRTKHLTSETIGKGLIGEIGREKGEEMNQSYRSRRLAQIGTTEIADWRLRGVVSDVKDQGDCGACWAFAATAALESQIALKTGKLYDLSEQQCLDCSRKYGTDGCAGGMPEACYAYMLNERRREQHEYGIEKETNYPYQESDEDKRCHYNAASAVRDFKLIGWDYATHFPMLDSEEMLKKAVGNIGPIVAVINVTKKFDLYKDGIFFDEECNSESVKDVHAVTVVGYNKTAKGEEFWIVKNSWGKEWGKNGYVLMARNRDNNCMIAEHTLYPIIDRVAPFDGWNSDGSEEDEETEVDEEGTDGEMEENGRTLDHY